MNASQEQYIEHEVRLRVIESHNTEIYEKFNKIDQKIDSLEEKFETRFLMLVGLVLTSIILPVFLHALRLI
jgi:predicted mannosyl-3-phosphoglycerate phosphatase (HAD superfamily)